MEKLIKSLKDHEGYKDKIYMDSEGYLTCGWGHQLRIGSQIPLAAADAFFSQDLVIAMASYWSLPVRARRDLNAERRRVLVEMLFNMGLKRVMTFKKMLAALEADDYETAAKEMLDSKWHQQVGKRAEDLAEIMRKGLE